MLIVVEHANLKLKLHFVLVSWNFRF